MWGKRIRVLLVAVALAVAGCSDASPPEQTLATGTTAPETTTTVATTTTTTTTTTTAAPTTTQGPDARLAEIEERANEAAVTWLRAIYFEDLELLLAVAGSEAVYEAGVRAIEQGTVNFIAEPTAENTQVRVEQVVLDRDDCIAAEVIGTSESIPAQPEPSVDIWFPQPDGSFKLASSWASGTSRTTIEPDCDNIFREFQP